MESQRNVTLTRLIDDATNKLDDLAKWPESQATRDAVENAIKILRKTFKEESYPRAFLYLACCHMAHSIWADTYNRDVKNAGLKAAWMKIGELLD